MSKERILVWMPVFLLLILSVAMTDAGLGDPGPTTVFVTPSYTIAASGTFTVKINVSDVSDLYTFGIYMRWAGPILECTGATEGEFLRRHISPPEIDTYFIPSIFNEPDPVGDSDYVNLGNTLMGASAGEYGSGCLAEVEFLVEDAGVSALDIYIVELLDRDGDKMACEIEDGYFETSTWAARGEPGDVDGNHLVDVVDLGIVARAMGTNPDWPHGTDWHQWNPDADLNGDLKVDVFDLVIVGINYGQPWY